MLESVLRSNLVFPWYYGAGKNSDLAGEYETEQDGDGQLAVTEEDDVEEVRVGGVLQEKPAKFVKIPPTSL